MTSGDDASSCMSNVLPTRPSTARSPTTGSTGRSIPRCSRRWWFLPAGASPSVSHREVEVEDDVALGAFVIRRRRDLAGAEATGDGEGRRVPGQDLDRGV